jgi:hypothetical protein
MNGRRLVLPDSQEFKSQIIDFKERLVDRSVPNTFARNSMTLDSSIQTKPLAIDVGKDRKMKIGVRRDQADLNGFQIDELQ